MRQVSLSALLGPEGDEQQQGTALLDVRPQRMARWPSSTTTIPRTADWTPTVTSDWGDGYCANR
jgi:hypothetical protein